MKYPAITVLRRLFIIHNTNILDIFHQSAALSLIFKLYFGKPTCQTQVFLGEYNVQFKIAKVLLQTTKIALKGLHLKDFPQVSCTNFYCNILLKSIIYGWTGMKRGKIK